jgi:CRISPR/Cas system-associated protein Csx1
MTEFIANLNKFNSYKISNVKHQLIDALSSSDDVNLHNLVNSKIVTYSINQQFSQNNSNIILQIKNTSFLEVLDYMTTSCLAMTSNIEYINENIYIIDKNNINDHNISPFNHIKLKGKLSQYQIYFYTTILNYQAFVKALD